MSGIGLVVSYIGYCILYWALQSIQGKTQPSFAKYLFPFGQGPDSTGVGTGQVVPLQTASGSGSGSGTTTKTTNPPKTIPRKPPADISS